MAPGVYNVITWMIVGLCGASLAALAVTGSARGFGLLRTVALGISGALVGGVTFRLFDLLPNLERISISLRDVLAAFAGSLVVVLAHWIWRRFRPAPGHEPPGDAGRP